MQLYDKVRSGFRNLFNIRKARKLVPVGSRPVVDTYICRRDVKMLVTHEIDDSLWQWLAMCGWRKITVPNDRRHYHRLPKTALKILIRTPPEQLDDIHRRMMAAVAKSGGRGASRPKPGR